MNLLKRALRLARLTTLSPSRAAEACAEPGALSAAAAIYAATLLAAAVYFRFKPWDFPDATAAPPYSAGAGLGFWLGVMLWQPLLLGVLVACAAILLRWMKDGWLPLKVASATAWTALPLILTVAYLKGGLAKPVFGAGMILWAAPGVWVARGVTPAEWRMIGTFLLALNAVELFALLPEALATAARSVAAYKAVVAGAGLWMLGAGALGLRALLPRAMPRAVLPLLFALVLQIVVTIACYMLGWLPPETLKALIYG